MVMAKYVMNIPWLLIGCKIDLAEMTVLMKDMNGLFADKLSEEELKPEVFMKAIDSDNSGLVDVRCHTLLTNMCIV